MLLLSLNFVVKGFCSTVVDIQCNNNENYMYRLSHAVVT